MPGIDLATEVEEKKKGRRLYKPEEGGSKNLFEQDDEDVDPA